VKRARVFIPPEAMTVPGGTARYLSAGEVGARYGVTAQAVKHWRRRYPEGSQRPFPRPDVQVGPGGGPGSAYGWAESRLPELDAWHQWLRTRSTDRGQWLAEAMARPAPDDADWRQRTPEASAHALTGDERSTLCGKVADPSWPEAAGDAAWCRTCDALTRIS
jgi:hypothetical protein